MLPILIGFVVYISTSFGSEVTQLGKDPNLVLITQDNARAWQVGDKACVVRGLSNIGCGSITKKTAEKAVLKITDRRTQQKMGMGDRVVVNHADADRSLASISSLQETEVPPMEKFSQGQVSLELLGAALGYSVFGSFRPIPYLSANLGFSYFSASASASTSSGTTSAGASIIQFPASVSLLLGSRDHSFETLAGADIVLMSANASAFGVGGSASGTVFLPEFGMGYRYWPGQGGFHFRSTLYGILAPSSNAGGTTAFIPWLGVSFGYAF